MKTLLTSLFVLAASLTLGARDAHAQFSSLFDAVDEARRVIAATVPVREPWQPTCCGGISCEQARELNRMLELRIRMSIRGRMDAESAARPETIDALLADVVEAARPTTRPVLARPADRTAGASSRAGLD
jgi:hypothetical protein